jgi:peptidoglycan/xylan/chitin deacetylase (PgdA/CDA1 family)
MHIADEIEKRGWKGHFFITTGRIDYRKFLTKKDIAELDARGHVIGSHSHTHPDIFYNLSREKMLEEWKVSCDILSELIQKPVVTASVPGGDMNLLTQMTAKSAGIKYLFTSEPIATPWEDDGLICIGRFCLKKDSPPDLVRDFAQFRGFFRQKFIRMTKQSVKRAIAPYYQWKMSSNKMQSS